MGGRTGEAVTAESCPCSPVHSERAGQRHRCLKVQASQALPQADGLAGGPVPPRGPIRVLLRPAATTPHKS